MGVLGPIPRKRRKESAASILFKILRGVSAGLDAREARKLAKEQGDLRKLVEKERETRDVSKRTAARTKETKGFHEKLMKESRSRGEGKVGEPLFRRLAEKGRGTRALAQGVVREGNVEIVDGVPVFTRSPGKSTTGRAGGKLTDAQLLRKKWLGVFDVKTPPEQNENALPIRALKTMLEFVSPTDTKKVLGAVQSVLPKTVANDPDVLDAVADYIDANPSFFFKEAVDTSNGGLGLGAAFRALFGKIKGVIGSGDTPVESTADSLGIDDPDLRDLIDELGLE